MLHLRRYLCSATKCNESRVFDISARCNCFCVLHLPIPVGVLRLLISLRYPWREPILQLCCDRSLIPSRMTCALDLWRHELHSRLWLVWAGRKSPSEECSARGVTRDQHGPAVSDEMRCDILCSNRRCDVIPFGFAVPHGDGARCELLRKDSPTMRCDAIHMSTRTWPGPTTPTTTTTTTTPQGKKYRAECPPFLLSSGVGASIHTLHNIH